MARRNICKFVGPQEHGHLIASNFVYECALPQSGAPQALRTHVMYLVSAGEGRLVSGSKRYTLTQGTVFLTFADVPFVLENTGEINYYYISFTGSRADELFRRFGLTPAVCLFRGCEGLLPLWKESLARAGEENIDLLAEGLLLYTFSRLSLPEQKFKDAVAFVLSYVEEHFTDSELSLGMVADAAGYNAKYLSHLFVNRYGMSFTQHLKLVRIRHAVMLIENGVTAVKNVAALCGYSDPLYFSRVFREVVGVSPGRYRKR